MIKYRLKISVIGIIIMLYIMLVEVHILWPSTFFPKLKTIILKRDAPFS